jgi:hypothetical protein
MLAEAEHNPQERVEVLAAGKPAVLAVAVVVAVVGIQQVV